MIEEKAVSYRTKHRYNITIVERLERVVSVEAEDPREAQKLVASAWKDGKYVLDASDFTDVSFTPVSG